MSIRIFVTGGTFDKEYNERNAFAQTLPLGVYIAMNGKCFPADRFQKNKQTGIFENLS